MAPLHIDHHGHRTRLKWHRGRRRAADPAFTGARIVEAMQVGASVEVDLVIHADHGCAILHDLTLDRETTGTGTVRETGAVALRALRLRGHDGEPIDAPVMLLEDLCERLVGETIHPDASLQLDFKEDLASLSPDVISNFSACITPIAGSVILSGGDFDAIAMLADATPGLSTGYDPCYGSSLARLQSDGDHAGFIKRALATAPEARIIYLSHEIILAADDAGVDIVAPVHEAGRHVDAWTINSVTSQTIAKIDRLLALKVDQITTDDPEGVAEAFRQ